MKHECLDEEEVVRIAAGLVPSDRAARMVAEVEQCIHCRSLLVEAGVALQNFAPSLEPVFRVGESVAGRYQVKRFVGRGGMGEVFEVFDSELHERAALKTIREELSDNPAVVKRFKQELRLARKVVHPNVGRVFDLGTTTDRRGHPLYFHTMEFIDGASLMQWKGGRELSIGIVLRVANQLAAGLAAIHEHGIVHRDLKPENVIVRTGSLDSPCLTILDFGVARSRERLSGLATTGPGVRMGTPDYMAPEVLRGTPASTTSDVFSFGLLIYELLTNRHPFPNAGTRVALSALGELRLNPPEHFRADVPAELSEVLVSCLANEPRDRPSSGSELLRLLARLEQRRQATNDRGSLWDRLLGRLARRERQ